MWWQRVGICAIIVFASGSAPSDARAAEIAGRRIVGQELDALFQKADFVPSLPEGEWVSFRGESFSAERKKWVLRNDTGLDGGIYRVTNDKVCVKSGSMKRESCRAVYEIGSGRYRLPNDDGSSPALDVPYKLK